MSLQEHATAQLGKSERCPWLPSFASEKWERFVLRATETAGAPGLDLPAALRICAESISAFVSPEAVRIVGSKWIFHEDRAESFWLGADFNYGLVLLAERSEARLRLLAELSRRAQLLRAEGAAEVPAGQSGAVTAGLIRLRQGLVDKAVEALLQAEAENELDAAVQLLLGELCLYGADEYVSVINPEKAERYLLSSSRFLRLQAGQFDGWGELAGECFFHAAVACYAQANDAALAGLPDAASTCLTRGLGHLQRALERSANRPEYSYQHARFLVLLGRADAALDPLRVAFRADPNYFIKADCDPDFLRLRGSIFALVKSMADELHKQLERVLSGLLAVRNNRHYSVLGARAEEAFAALTRFGSPQQELADRRYLPLLDGLTQAEQIRDRFEQLNREGLIGDARPAQAAFLEALGTARESIHLAEQLGLSNTEGREKLRQLENAVRGSRPYYADALREADRVRTDTLASVAEHFQRLQVEASEELQHLHEQLETANALLESCRGIFGGSGFMAGLLGIVVGGFIGFMVGFTVLFGFTGLVFTLLWFAWQDGILARLRWQLMISRSESRLNSVEQAVLKYRELVQKCEAGSLRPADVGKLPAV